MSTGPPRLSIAFWQFPPPELFLLRCVDPYLRLFHWAASCSVNAGTVRPISLLSSVPCSLPGMPHVLHSVQISDGDAVHCREGKRHIRSNAVTTGEKKHTSRDYKEALKTAI